ncbi:hypothetical protein ABZT17_38970 [Streptomyces sp. NPDC005648]|uniref:hypothetical protein n=1 Tax=Streptomyces sp. NPDC005648 TaxID=3157044 RepID=UPI00339FC99D
MYEFEISQIRSAELIRRADEERLAREAARTRRAARREARHAAENEPHSFSLRRLRSRAA